MKPAGTHVSTRTIEVVSAVIIHNGRILLTQRGGGKDYPFTWECPGGKVDGDESHHAALTREVGEELDLYTRSISNTALWCGKVTDEIFLLMYRLAPAGTPRLLEDQLGMGWFTAEEIEHLALTPGNKMALPMLVSAMSKSCGPKCWASVDCATCGMRKKPVGRSVSMEAANGYCDEECAGYRQVPHPPHLFNEHDSNRYYSDPAGWEMHLGSCADCRGDA